MRDYRRRSSVATTVESLTLVGTASYCSPLYPWSPGWGWHRYRSSGFFPSSSSLIPFHCCLYAPTVSTPSRSIGLIKSLFTQSSYPIVQAQYGNLPKLRQASSYNSAACYVEQVEPQVNTPLLAGWSRLSHKLTLRCLWVEQAEPQVNTPLLAGWSRLSHKLTLRCLLGGAGWATS